eukprot:6467375-Amphidinium_carterae.1
MEPYAAQRIRIVRSLTCRKLARLGRSVSRQPSGGIRHAGNSRETTDCCCALSTNTAQWQRGRDHCSFSG